MRETSHRRNGFNPLQFADVHRPIDRCQLECNKTRSTCDVNSNESAARWSSVGSRALSSALFCINGPDALIALTCRSRSSRTRIRQHSVVRREPQLPKRTDPLDGLLI